MLTLMSNLPENARFEKRYVIEGDMMEAKEKFYELAKSRIQHLNNAQTVEWVKTGIGVGHEASAGCVVAAGNKMTPEGNVEKWVEGLEIIINDDALAGFEDIVPFVVEHEIYEIWLTSKKGAGENLTPRQMHLLSRRKQYLAAEEAGKGERLLEFHTREALKHGKEPPLLKQECEEALAYAKRRIEARRKANKT